MIKKGIIDGFYPDQDTIPDGFIKTRYQIWSRTKVFVSMAREELNLNQDLKRLADHYRNINSRMVIIHGSEDRIVPVQNARKLHEAINNSVLHVFPGIGHYVQFASPAEVKEILLNL
ncbi:MAG: alpha/beta fold hydrolase [Spirochaetota bacterium]